MLSLVRRFLSLAAGCKPVPASLMNYFPSATVWCVEINAT